jgi:hypothetical protein
MMRRLDRGWPSHHNAGRMRSKIRRLALKAAAVCLGLSASSCDYLEDRFKTCDDVVVVLVNSEQTRGTYHLTGPDEVAANENLVESGASRTIGLCLDLGHSYRFRAMQDGRVVGTVQCPASRTDYEAVDVRVIWTPVGFQCFNW